MTLLQPMMNPLERECSGGGTEDVGQQVVGIISTAAWRETLVILVQDACECDDDDGSADDELPVRGLWSAPE